MYKGVDYHVSRRVLTSLKKGSSIVEACRYASVSVATFWRWRKKDARLDNLTKGIYDSRIAIVEDALYKEALNGNVSAQIFFLKNRDVNRWRDRHDFEGDGIIKPIINIVNYDKQIGRIDDTSSRIPAEQVRIRDFSVSGEVQEHQLASTGAKDDVSIKQVNT